MYSKKFFGNNFSKLASLPLFALFLSSNLVSPSEAYSRELPSIEINFDALDELDNYKQKHPDFTKFPKIIENTIKQTKPLIKESKPLSKAEELFNTKNIVEIENNLNNAEEKLTTNKVISDSNGEKIKARQQNPKDYINKEKKPFDISKDVLQKDGRSGSLIDKTLVDKNEKTDDAIKDKNLPVFSSKALTPSEANEREENLAIQKTQKDKTTKQLEDIKQSETVKQSEEKEVTDDSRKSTLNSLKNDYPKSKEISKDKVKLSPREANEREEKLALSNKKLAPNDNIKNEDKKTPNTENIALKSKKINQPKEEIAHEQEKAAIKPKEINQPKEEMIKGKNKLSPREANEREEKLAVMQEQKDPDNKNLKPEQPVKNTQPAQLDISNKKNIEVNDNLVSSKKNELFVYKKEDTELKPVELISDIKLPEAKYQFSLKKADELKSSKVENSKNVTNIQGQLNKSNKNNNSLPPLQKTVVSKNNIKNSYIEEIENAKLDNNQTSSQIDNKIQKINPDKIQEGQDLSSVLMKVNKIDDSNSNADVEKEFFGSSDKKGQKKNDEFSLLGLGFAQLDRKMSVPKSPEKTGALQDNGAYITAIEFVSNNVELSNDNKNSLEKIKANLKTDPSKRIKIISYASGVEGDSNSAQRISLKRAITIRSFLIKSGIDTDKISIQAAGRNIKDIIANKAEIYIVEDV